MYDEEREMPNGGGSCWSYSGSGSGSETGLEVGIEPLALEGAVVEVIQEREGHCSWGTGWQEGGRVS